MNHDFHTTRWSLVLAAAGESPDAENALAWLCETYWYPLYAFVRRQGYDSDEASDLVQSYFLRFLEKGFLSRIDPAAGKFRSFLLVSLKHFLSNERVRAQAIKRRADDPSHRVSLAGAEERYQQESGDHLDAEALYDRRWALIVFERAMARLTEEQRPGDKAGRFRLLRRFITGEGGDTPYARVAKELNISDGAVKVAVHRLRHRLGELLREEVAQTMASGEDVDTELRYLLDVVGR